MTSIVEPTGSRRRRRFLLVPVLLVAAAALYITVGALAVHDTGRFQLDGDASSSTNTAGTPAASDDWDKVCQQYANPKPTGGCGTPTPSNTTGSTSGGWASDGSLQATIFTGGGSKDPQDITNWAWKDGAGGLPDKDNLLHAFAVRYSLTPSTTCPAGTFATCELLYFGEDRFDNSGDAQNGFWFLQSRIGLGSNSSGGGTGFTGSHVNGDVLVVSDFSNGGTVSTINVYKWDTACTAANKPDATCADANLRTLLAADAANCKTVGSADAACGLVNPSNGTAVPWSGDYTDKSGNHSYLNGEFYEAGINLSTLGLAGECFSSMVTETRSSTSTTAVLKDFVITPLSTCKPNLSTQASATVATPVLPGTPVHDTATVTITGGANPPDPTGTVTFSYCYNATSVPDCNTATRTSAGTGLLGDSNHDGVIDDTTPNNGSRVALSDNINTATAPLPPGYYCFYASWPGDTQYPPTPPATAFTATNQTTECFRIKDTSSLSTHQIWLPNDRATVMSTAGTALNGTVKFELYSGSTCSGTKLWPRATDPAGTGEFTLTNATSPAQVGPTNNTAVTVEADATVSWKVTFTSNNTGVDSPATPTCEVSTLDLTPNQ
jgi:hypothetical protein